MDIASVYIVTPKAFVHRMPANGWPKRSEGERMAPAFGAVITTPARRALRAIASGEHRMSARIEAAGNRLGRGGHCAARTPCTVGAMLPLAHPTGLFTVYEELKLIVPSTSSTRILGPFDTMFLICSYARSTFSAFSPSGTASRIGYTLAESSAS
jgi:hypothetical protein